MTLPRLYPILDTESLARRSCDVVQAAEAMLAGGARILQFRHKRDYTREVFDRLRTVAALCHGAGAAFIVNDRADLARLVDAGVHLGQDDLPPSDARRILGPQRLIGLSTHNSEQLSAARTEPIDYIAFGPVFATLSKTNANPSVGLDGLSLVTCTDAGGLPVVAVGGITRENARLALAAGAASLAVIQDLLPEPCTPEGLRARMEEWQRLVTN